MVFVAVSLADRVAYRVEHGMNLHRILGFRSVAALTFVAAALVAAACGGAPARQDRNVIEVEASAPASPDGTPFQLRGSPFQITVPSTWTLADSDGTPGATVWDVGAEIDGLQPNVVMTYESGCDCADLETAVRDAAVGIEGGYSLQETPVLSIVTETDGRQLGVVEADSLSGRLSFIVYIAVSGDGDDIAAAVLTAPTDSLPALREQVEPYLRSLRLTGVSAG